MGYVRSNVSEEIVRKIIPASAIAGFGAFGQRVACQEDGDPNDADKCAGCHFR
jgi:hypothetical protein